MNEEMLNYMNGKIKENKTGVLTFTEKEIVDSLNIPEDDVCQGFTLTDNGICHCEEY